MRSGCGSGCLTVLVVLVLAAGTVWATAGLFQPPDVPHVTIGHDDWVTAQQKLFSLGRRSRSRSGQKQSVALSERELTAIVTRYLSESRTLPLSGVSVRVTDQAAAEIVGQIPVRTFTPVLMPATILDWLPERWTRQAVWVTVLLRPRVEGVVGTRRYLVLDVERLTIGRRWVPGLLLRLLLPTEALRHFSVPLPESVGGIALERGRLLISVASPSTRSRDAPSTRR